MKLTVWGCRGSLATPGGDTVKYGGNTSCVEVRAADDTVMIFDAGTGIRPLGNQIAEQGLKTVHIFLSHLHMDHLQGLAFFGPLYDPTVELHVWGPPSPVRSLAERISTYMSEPLFPVNLSDIPCRASFHDAPEDGVKIGSAEVWASSVSHQGPTVGYRIEEGGHALAYIPDHEPGRGSDLNALSLEWVSGGDLARDADILLHDAQYTEDEYPHHVGWGHSSIEHVVAFARLAAVRQLILFHHDPRHTDAMLEGVLRRASDLWGDGGKPPILAYEGMTIDLSADL